MQACYKGHLEIIKLLVENDADLNMQEKVILFLICSVQTKTETTVLNISVVSSIFYLTQMHIAYYSHMS